MVDWRDHNFIVDLIETNPNASLVLHIHDNNMTDEDWEKVRKYYIMTQKNLKVLLDKMNFDYCADNHIPYFFSMPISTGWEANALINIGVCSLYITGQLAHQLDFVKNLPVEIRVKANSSMAPLNYKPLIGGWYRPEDLYKLDMIDVCEFVSRDNKEEQALYRIYAVQHEWPSQLNLIVKDVIDDKIINRLIPPDFQERRSNCGMRCQSGAFCHYCESIKTFANSEIIKDL